MLLILSNSKDVTADYLAEVLLQNCIPCVRFDTDASLPKTAFRFSSAGAELQLNGTWFRPTDFSHVWYRRPERLCHPSVSDSPEGKFLLDEWAEAIECFLAHIPVSLWMNHPAMNSAASRKLEQLTAARELGMTVPETLVTQDPAALGSFFEKWHGEIIVKPLSLGYVERSGGVRDSLIYTNRVTRAHLHDLRDLSACPTFFQQMVRKTADVRITVVDEALHAIELRAEDSQGVQRCDIRRNNMEDVRYADVRLPPSVESQLWALMRRYHLRFAAVDMAIDETGNWVFFEINPNGQWAWLDLCGASNIAASFVRSFTGPARRGS